VARCESLGLPASPDVRDAPASLLAVCEEVRACTAVPRLLPETTAPEVLDAVGARKRWQIQALLDAASELCRDASRIVEVGAGRGHLTRVAAHRFEREALGIERDAGRVARAIELAARHGVGAARFVAADALAGDLPLAAGDLALGLHACGEIGDHLVVGAARAGCHLALVACCAQKMRAKDRAPLSSTAAGRRVPASRQTLGLANLGGGAHGIEAPVAASMAAREARWSLRWLLAERGVQTMPGEEMRGVNRRRARGGLEVLVRLALEARRLPPATVAELARCRLEGRREFALVRRLALPRNMLGRALEVFLMLDRAQHLVERGYRVRAGELFATSRSPRNLAVVARAPA
jgi:SAM-dependent methyltransferase